MKARIDVSDVPECVSCGACCFSNAQDYLLVAGVDFERLGKDAERLTVSQGPRTYMKMSGGHCAALSFAQESGSFLCSVYEKRPDVCRWLERGSGQCASERREKSERPIELRRKESVNFGISHSKQV